MFVCLFVRDTYSILGHVYYTLSGKRFLKTSLYDKFILVRVMVDAEPIPGWDALGERWEYTLGFFGQWEKTGEVIGIPHRHEKNM